MKTRVVVIYGGRSAEHEVSLKSAMTVINALDRQFYEVIPVYISPSGVWRRLADAAGPIGDPAELRVELPSAHPGESMGDVIRQVFARPANLVAFPVIHGANGEDGTLQGLLELLNVPYVGNGVLASAAGMDKEMTKRVLAAEGIPQAAFAAFRLHEWEKRPGACLDTVAREIGFPCYVKPANQGSSIGIRRCENRDAWADAAEEAFRYDNKIVVEEEIVGREVQIAVLGTEEPECSVTGEFVREPAFFDFDQKYRQGALVQRIPAAISAETEARIRRLALRAFRALSGSGLMRVDFFVTEEDRIYLNEVNTLPGFTLNSMFPVLWNRTNGMTYSQLLNRMIRHALERHALKQSVCFHPMPALTGNAAVPAGAASGPPIESSIGASDAGMEAANR
jgi:D-alanine-D-alanine ligase